MPRVLGLDNVRCVTVDVEEYFHIEAARGVVDADARGRHPRRAGAAMDRLLGLFDAHGVRATLFFLADVARGDPALVKRCRDAGHEVASHGAGHERLHRLTPVAFAQTLHDSRRRLEDLTGEAVLGYRAPTWSLTRETAWAVDVLAEAGFAYDASVFPVRHPQYGVPGAPATPFHVRGTPGGAAMLEVPPLVYEVKGRHVACAGGGWFRLLPAGLMRRGLVQARRRGRPAVLYFHPWEFDPETPRLPMGWVGRVRTYTGLRSSLGKLDAVLGGFGPWVRLRDRLPAFEAMAAQRPPFVLDPARARRAA